LNTFLLIFPLSFPILYYEACEIISFAGGGEHFIPSCCCCFRQSSSSVDVVVAKWGKDLLQITPITMMMMALRDSPEWVSLPMYDFFFHAPITRTRTHTVCGVMRWDACNRWSLREVQGMDGKTKKMIRVMHGLFWGIRHTHTDVWHLMPQTWNVADQRFDEICRRIWGERETHFWRKLGTR
jgi:hypothetical protein